MFVIGSTDYNTIALDLGWIGLFGVPNDRSEGTVIQWDLNDLVVLNLSNQKEDEVAQLLKMRTNTRDQRGGNREVC